MTLTHRHVDALAFARLSPALRRTGRNAKVFVTSPMPASCAAVVSGAAVRDLVDAGLMRWVNKCKSAAVLTEKGRR